MKKLQIVLAFLLVVFFVVPVQDGVAQSGISGYVKSSPLSEKSTYNVLFPYKAEPLSEGKTPLLLIHGIGGEDEKLYNWARFLEFVERHPEFSSRYKVYLFRYDSSQSVPELSGMLQETLRQFIQQTGGRQFRVLAYSEGGLLTRNALQDPVIHAHVDKVITVGTPFHGSPLASPDWLRKQLRQTSIFSPVRMTNRISYWVARRMFPSFEADFHWDNFDTAISEEEYAMAKGRGYVQGYAAAHCDKFVTYGSYFGVDIDPDQALPKALGVHEPLPTEKPRFRNPFSRHFLFSLIRNNISKLPLAYLNRKKAPASEPVEEANTLVMGESIAFAAVDSSVELMIPEPGAVTTASAIQTSISKEVGEVPALMVYNDGISPISSTLWLGRFLPNLKQVDNPSLQMINALKQLSGTSSARLFPGLDHRDWMDGSTRIDRPQVQDLLHPKEPPRTVFEWFLHDLMAEPVVTAAS